MTISIDDLIERDDEARAVYLTILYLRFLPSYRINFLKYPDTTPSEILTVYFNTLSRDKLENVKNSMAKFHRRFDQALALDSGQIIEWNDFSISSEPSRRDAPRLMKTKNEWLEELEVENFTRFKEAFEGFIRLDKIPPDYQNDTRDFLELAHKKIIGERFTRAGSAKIPYSQISVVREMLRENEVEFVNILRESRIAFRSPKHPMSYYDSQYDSQSSVIIPSVIFASRY